ncbi:MAG: hypothetical protein EA383_00450 [Spirochaetaceae bacterium]|nr:MAG: hypothetical protein EA383_00450 [Spirochaetaceae bacterium]
MDSFTDTRYISVIMKHISIILLLIFVVAVSVSAENRPRVILGTEYSVPLNPPALESGEELPPGAADTLAFAAGYRFWGIGIASVHLYNEILYGQDNPVGLGVRPLGLFSAGLGLEIPLGGPSLILDWQRLFTGPSAPNTGVIDYAGQFKIGVSLPLFDFWRVHVFSRNIRNFSDRARTDFPVIGDDPSLQFSNIGIGTTFRF